ncbi:hypothetical protein AYR66_18465 [Noviherbaspirillum denitrificans]|uniref:Phospholipid/glycerol acyltransferase domain-containing protein n=1 Tax=Noviherbaspirillum denitrificans TaxID=1968433 RepID=A0A254TEY4_9BURK|nr:hypothetical protein AYR66_18465 [Noviherbaspirillum denitrificans]
MFRSACIPLRVDGLDRLPKHPHILIANHASFLDALILTAALPASPGYAFVARQEFRSQALLWPILRAVGTIILRPHTDHAAHANIERLRERLEEGDNLVIFPEGAIARAPGLRPFHSGAFVIAARHGVPIVLAGMRGARQALPLKTWQPVRTPLMVVVHAVWQPGDDHDGSPEDMAQAAREAMAPLAGEDIVPSTCSEP